MKSWERNLAQFQTVLAPAGERRIEITEDLRGTQQGLLPLASWLERLISGDGERVAQLRAVVGAG